MGPRVTGKKPLRRPRYSWKDNTGADLTEACEELGWVQLEYGLLIVNETLNLQVLLPME